MQTVTYESRDHTVVQLFTGVAQPICDCTSRDAAERIAAALNVLGHLSVSGIKALGLRLAAEATR